MIRRRLTIIIITFELERKIAFGLTAWCIWGVELGVRLLCFVHIIYSIEYLHVDLLILDYIDSTVIIETRWDQHWRHLEHVLYILWSLHWFSLAGGLGTLLRFHLVSFYNPHTWFVITATNAEPWSCHLPLGNFDVVPHTGVSVLLISRTYILFSKLALFGVEQLRRFDFCLWLVDRFQVVMWKFLNLWLNLGLSILKWQFGGAQACLCLSTLIVLIFLRALLTQIKRCLLLYSYFIRAAFWA